ncbi:MAG: rod-binding protein [Pseudomonadales bacterium]|nr:rod-binding protein [Pseudomonadales bacterium]
MNPLVDRSVQGAVSSHYDLAGLESLKRDAGNDKGVREVAEQFESIFVNMMLKSARESVIDGGLFSDSSLKTYQEMFDHEIAMNISTKGNGVGLADMIVAQISRSRGEG